MKIVFRTAIFHLLCILIFSVVYYIFREDYDVPDHKKSQIIDFIFLSTTIQAGVGIADIYPTKFYGKIVMMIQQLIMLFTNIFTIYILTV
jgi:hypothetical protein|uniref:Potassium channel domain-containing protein n=1 Tax=viral metagenome TaxID=1070528 RepID=A0A6C0ID37_9ZZZZ